MTNTVTFELIDKTDAHLCMMTVEKFFAAVKSGSYNDYDGFGEYATQDEVSNLRVYPSTLGTAKVPSWATHIVWYNK